MVKTKKFIYNYEMIDVYLQTHKLNKRQFCERCKICSTTLNKFYHAKLVHVFSLLKVVDVLGVAIHHFFMGIKE